MMIYDKYLNDDNVLNIYIFGSHLYGSNNQYSDMDIILIVKEWFDSEDINIHVYTINQFQLLLDRHDIQAIECMSTRSSEFVPKYCHSFKYPKINKAKLRVSISTIASNSWVKGKKKLTVAGDYDLNLAIKSIFHSLRILDFGIQIASTGFIENFSSMNWLLDDLKKLSESYQREELWQKIDEKYRALYNSKSTEFKKLAPKDLDINKRSDELKSILKSYNVDYNEGMINKILTLLEK